MAAVGTRSFTQIHPACAAKKVESPPADFHAGPGMNAGTFQMDRIGKNKIVEHHMNKLEDLLSKGCMQNIAKSIRMPETSEQYSLCAFLCDSTVWFC